MNNSMMMMIFVVVSHVAMNFCVGNALKDICGRTVRECTMGSIGGSGNNMSSMTFSRPRSESFSLCGATLSWSPGRRTTYFDPAWCDKFTREVMSPNKLVFENHNPSDGYMAFRCRPNGFNSRGFFSQLTMKVDSELYLTGFEHVCAGTMTTTTVSPGNVDNSTCLLASDEYVESVVARYDRYGVKVLTLKLVQGNPQLCEGVGYSTTIRYRLVPPDANYVATHTVMRYEKPKTNSFLCGFRFRDGAIIYLIEPIWCDSATKAVILQKQIMRFSAQGSLFLWDKCQNYGVEALRTGVSAHGHLTGMWGDCRNGPHCGALGSTPMVTGSMRELRLFASYDVKSVVVYLDAQGVTDVEFKIMSSV